MAGALRHRLCSLSHGRLLETDRADSQTAHDTTAPDGQRAHFLGRAGFAALEASKQAALPSESRARAVGCRRATHSGAVLCRAVLSHLPPPPRHKLSLPLLPPLPGACNMRPVSAQIGAASGSGSGAAGWRWRQQQQQQRRQEASKQCWMWPEWPPSSFLLLGSAGGRVPFLLLSSPGSVGWLSVLLLLPWPASPCRCPSLSPRSALASQPACPASLSPLSHPTLPYPAVGMPVSCRVGGRK